MRGAVGVRPRTGEDVDRRAAAGATCGSTRERGRGGRRGRASASSRRPALRVFELDDARGPGWIGSHDAASVSGIVTGPRTSSSRWSAIGRDRAVPGPAQQLGVDARVRRGDAGDLVLHLFERARGRSPRPSRSASSAAMRQSGIAVPSGETFWPTRCTRPSRFVTLPVFSPHIVTGRKTSARFVLSVTNVSIAIVNPAALSAPSASAVVGEVVVRVRAEQHRTRGCGPARRPRGSPRRRGPGLAGTEPHA